VGDFELHPGASAEFGYDSNYLRVSGLDGTPVLGALRLRLTPSFSFSTLTAQRRETAPSTSQPSVEFRGGVSLTYNEFIPVSGTDAQKSSISNLRNVGANVDMMLHILPGRPWSGQLNASYARILTASADGGASSFNSQGTLNRDVPIGGAELIWAPGSGLLDWRLGYQFQGTLFEDSSVGNLTNLSNQIETRGRWRFLPRTSLVYDAKFGFISYPSPTTNSNNNKVGSHPMRALIGINGLFTSSFAVLAMVGWGASFYQATNGAQTQNFDSAIGQAELKWFITPNPSTDPAAATVALSSISVGFLRDFYDSYIGNYFERDRGYLSLSYFYGGKFLLVLDGGAGPVIYPPMPNLKVTGTTTNIRIDTSLFAEYRFKDAFGLNATVRYNDNIDPNGTVITNGAAQSHLSFREIEAYLGLRWLM
jgi:hypothetical protein